MAVFQIRVDERHTQRGNEYLIDNPKANLVIITGMAEHSRRYEPLAKRLNYEGYSVSVLDHWGQGENCPDVKDLQKWEKGSWYVSLRALNLVVEKMRKHTGKPVYLMGHSMGSFMVQNYLFYFPETVDKAIIMGSNGPNGKCVLSMGNMLAKMLTTKKNWDKPAKPLDRVSLSAYAKSIKNRKTDCDWLSYNEENVKRYMNDPYCGHMNTYGFFHEFLGAMVTLYKKKNLARVSKKQPLLIIAGDSDPVGACGKGPKALEKMYKNLGVKEVELKVYQHMRHEILNEVDSNIVMDDIVTFLNK